MRCFRLCKPRIGIPVTRITTQEDLENLNLSPSTSEQIQTIITWLSRNQIRKRAFGQDPRIRQGYRVLFHGPPGTGKTLTASLIGKITYQDVYKIDLASIVSKYIGETEKNLSRLFDRAESKGWILFFDEADALFGKRSQVQDSHDRYANQEIAYLMQRIEAYRGLVIVASSKMTEIDKALLKRFQAIIHFPVSKTVTQ